MWIFQARVASITEEFKKTNYRQLEDKDKTWAHDQISLGWFVSLEGSHEKLFFGWECPALKVGNKVKVTIEKV